jgi:hypothetical protein
MIKCLNTAFCESYKTEDDGLITLEAIYTDFNPPGMPAEVKLCFVCSLELAIAERNMDKDFELRVIIKSPQGRTVDDCRQQIFFQQYTETTARCMVIIKYGEFTFTEFGKQSFEVYVNDKYLHTSVLNLNQENNK